MSVPSSADSEFKRYLFEYRHEDSEWGIEIIARSPTDASERLKSLAWASYQGEVRAKVPVPAGTLIQRILSRCGLI